MDAMMAKALTEGLGYALFVWLLLYILKQQKERDIKQDDRDEKAGEREKTYQNVILELTKNFEAVGSINTTVQSIKIKVEEILRKENN